MFIYWNMMVRECVHCSFIRTWCLGSAFMLLVFLTWCSESLFTVRLFEYDAKGVCSFCSFIGAWCSESWLLFVYSNMMLFTYSKLTFQVFWLFWKFTVDDKICLIANILNWTHQRNQILRTIRIQFSIRVSTSNFTFQVWR